MPYATYRFNKIIAAETIRFIVTVAIVVYKGLKLVVYRMLTNMIAQTILQQIGGKRFTAMTGSRDYINMGNGLRMSLARNKTSANRLDIIYDAGADL